MATYKVLQDIEAEDKFLGPLTLKQFIFAAIAIVSTYLSVIFLTKGVWVLVFPMAPVIIVTGFLAFPWGRDQPTEVWLLAKIRFMFKPRKRIWDQTGMQELVKITAPPQKAPEYFSDNLSQNEVRSRLRALADTVDSRGWAVKGVDPVQAATLVSRPSDRLVAASTLPQTSSTIDMPEVEDIFESPRADRLASQIATSDQQHRQAIVSQMQDVSSGSNQDAPTNNFWFMNQSSASAPGMTSFGAAQAPQNTAPENTLPDNMRRQAMPDMEDSQILDTIHANQDRARQSLRNHKQINPRGTATPVQARTTPVTAAPDPVTIELARDNNRSIASLAREANKLHQQPDDEVVISLH